MAKKRANGEGNIRKRADGRWEGRYTAGYHPETGKRIIENVLGKTQAECKAKLSAALESVKGIDVSRANEYTVATWLRSWYDIYAKPNVRIVTADRYQLMVEKTPVAAPADRSQPVERARYPAAATRLEAVAQSLSSLAETVNDVYNALPHRCESYRWVIDNTHDSLCFNCGRREQCWKQEYAATLEGMEALRPLLEENGRLEPAQLPGQLSRCIHPAALCAAAARSFALYRSRKESRLHAEAMRTVFTEQYSAVAEALAVLGEQLGRPGEPEPYRSDRVAAFFTSLGSPPLECAVTLDDLGRTHAAVTLPRTRFGPQELAALAREVGRICRRTLETPQVLSCKGMTTLLFSERPVLRAVFGMAGAAAQGEVSGDAVQQFCSPTAAQMILCDGKHQRK